MPYVLTVYRNEALTKPSCRNDEPVSFSEVSCSAWEKFKHCQPSWF